MVTRGQEEEEMGSYCSMDREFQFYKLKSVLKMDGGDSCTTL